MLALLIIVSLVALSSSSPLAVDASAVSPHVTSLGQSVLPADLQGEQESENGHPFPPSTSTGSSGAPDDSSLCTSMSYYLPSSVSSSLCPPVEAEAPSTVVKPVSYSKVAYAFLPNPSSFNVFVLLLTSLIIFSTKARKSMITYGGVATLCTWYAVRRVINRKEDQMNRRMSIKQNRTPSPIKRPKTLGLDTVSEEGTNMTGCDKKKMSPLKRLFKKSQ